MPVYIYTEIISARLLQEIYIRVYTYILVSLELLVSKRFNKILTILLFIRTLAIIKPYSRYYGGLINRLGR